VPAGSQVGVTAAAALAGGSATLVSKGARMGAECRLNDGQLARLRTALDLGPAAVEAGSVGTRDQRERPRISVNGWRGQVSGEDATTALLRSLPELAFTGWGWFSRIRGGVVRIRTAPGRVSSTAPTNELRWPSEGTLTSISPVSSSWSRPLCTHSAGTG
jgi:hypothetical protein